MKVFYDTEFFEQGGAAPIQLISIGAASEPGATYYGQSVEFDFNAANRDPWLRQHVIERLTLCPSVTEYAQRDSDGAFELDWYKHTHNTVGRCNDSGCPWRTRAQLAAEVRAFMQPGAEPPDLWADYAAYDHVALAQLFGRMIDLPQGWPMWTHDFQQLCEQLTDFTPPAQGDGEHNALGDALWLRSAYLAAQDQYRLGHLHWPGGR